MIENMMEQKQNHQGMLMILMIGGFSHVFLKFLLLKMYEKTQTCKLILQEKSFVLQVIFALFTSLSENCLNLGFYWLYYWRVKN